MESISRMTSASVAKDSERPELKANFPSRSWTLRTDPNVLRYRDDPTPMTIVPNIITADEVNCLIYSYLKDSGTLNFTPKNSCSDASVQVSIIPHSQSSQKVISIALPTSQSTSLVESSSTS